MRVPIVYQDENIVVASKPVGLSTHAGEEQDPGAADLVSIIKAQLGVDYLGTHQRLDRETSGVILFTLRREANPAVARIFFGHEAGKTYLAIVHGAFRPSEIAAAYRSPIVPRPPAPPPFQRGPQRGPMRGPQRGPEPPFRGRPFPAQGGRDRFAPANVRPMPPADFKSHVYKVVTEGELLSIDLPLAPGLEAGKMTVPARFDRQGQEATTKVRVLATSPDGRYSLLEVNALTGRTHQIRVHLAHLGHPVVGDGLYGSPAMPAPRLMLHAVELTMPAIEIKPEAAKEIASSDELSAAPTESSTELAEVAEEQLSDTQADPVVSSEPELAPTNDDKQAALAADSKPYHTFRAEPPEIFSRVAEGLPELEVAQRLAVPPAPVPQRLGRFAQAQTLEIDRLTLNDKAALTALYGLAASRRAPFEGDTETNIYRLVNAAADGLPGITVDRFGEVLVLSLYQDTAAAIEQMMVESLVEAIGSEYSVYLKRRPRTAATLDDATTAMAAPPAPAYGPRRPEIIARESGLNYIIRPIDGLSVGLFADMRETRMRVRTWAKGRSVLNCFAYTCGFGLAATIGGASRVVNLDLSRRYLEWGQENYTANNLNPSDRDFIFGDVLDWSFRYSKRGERFDMVILDPPSFSTTKGTRVASFSAEQDYGKLAELAARIINPGGLLLACTNHSGLNRRSFREMTLGGVNKAKRSPNVLGYFREPVLDFPAPGREEGYLKMLALEIK